MEFAILLPLIVLAALAVIQVGLVVRDQMGVVARGPEAARAASVDPDPGAAVRAAHRTLPGATVDVGARPGVWRRDHRHREVPRRDEPPSRRGAVSGSRSARVGDDAGRAVSERRGMPERGSVTILMVAVVVIGLVLSLGAARLGGAIVGRARADTAADASALAAADALALGDGPGAAHEAARATAASNDAHLVSCICAGTSAEVVVEVDVPGLGTLGAVARGRAKAQVRPGVCRRPPRVRLTVREVVDIAESPSYDLRLMAIAELLEGVLGGDLPIEVRAYDGSRAGPVDAPAALVLRSPERAPSHDHRAR